MGGGGSSLGVARLGNTAIAALYAIVRYGMVLPSMLWYGTTPYQTCHGLEEHLWWVIVQSWPHSSYGGVPGSLHLPQHQHGLQGGLWPDQVGRNGGIGKRR